MDEKIIKVTGHGAVHITPDVARYSKNTFNVGDSSVSVCFF